MTCREKLAKEHPKRIREEFVGGCEGCPCSRSVGYVSEEACNKFCFDTSLTPTERCTKCWDQEVTEKKSYKKKTTKTKKGNETTMKTTKKTKEELINEINELKKDLVQLERYKKYEEAANEVRAVHESFVNVGFTDEQAFELVKMAISKIRI